VRIFVIVNDESKIDYSAGDCNSPTIFSLPQPKKLLNPSPKSDSDLLKALAISRDCKEIKYQRYPRAGNSRIILRMELLFSLRDLGENKIFLTFNCVRILDKTW